MAIDNVFYTKIVNDEDEEDGTQFLAPKARGGVGLVLLRCVEASFKDIVGKHASLG